jgi:hypothetical protein
MVDTIPLLAIVLMIMFEAADCVLDMMTTVCLKDTNKELRALRAAHNMAPSVTTSSHLAQLRGFESRLDGLFAEWALIKPSLRLARTSRTLFAEVIAMELMNS